MKNKKRILSVVLSVFISVFLVAVFVYAATTIGSNITTAGTLTAGSASTSDNFWLGNETADDDDYLYMDASSTEYLMWDDAPGQFVLSDDLEVLGGNATVTGNFILGTTSWTARPTSTFSVIGTFHSTGIATASDAFWAGSGGVANEIDLAGGDLYVQNDAEIDADLYVTNKATSTVAHAVGSGTADNINMTGGDLYVQDDAEIDGDLFVTGAASSTTAIISGNATTTGNAVFGYNNQSASATTTLTLGSYDGLDKSGVCIKFWQSNTAFWCYVADVTGTFTFTCSTNTCE